LYSNIHTPRCRQQSIAVEWMRCCITRPASHLVLHHKCCTTSVASQDLHRVLHLKTSSHLAHPLYCYAIFATSGVLAPFGYLLTHTHVKLPRMDLEVEDLQPGLGGESFGAPCSRAQESRHLVRTSSRQIREYVLCRL